MDTKNVLIMVFLTAFIFGCAGETETTTGQTFVGGTSSIDMAFVAGAPPDSIFDQGEFEFDITIRLENNGEWDVPASDVLRFFITGINPSDWNDFNDDKSPISVDLNGVSLDAEGNRIPGDISFESFTETGNKASYTGAVAGPTDFTLRTDLCYKYGTTAQGELCVRSDPLSTAPSPVCSVTGSKTIESSAAPVQIVELKEQPAGNDKVSFSFKIMHQGTGTIYDPDKTAESGDDLACDTSSVTDKNKVHLKVSLVGDDSGMTLNCAGLTNNEGDLTLFNEERLQTCTVELSGITTDFTKLISIEATYNYYKFIQKKITVKSSG